MGVKVITSSNVRWSYLNVFEPKSVNGSTPKYSVSLIIPKSDTLTISRIQQALKDVYRDSLSVLKGSAKVAPAFDKINIPLHDGDEKKPNDPAYANAYYINATGTEAPKIVDTNKQEILDRSEIYSGCYGRASINFYAYNRNGNKGIGCGLNHLQKFRDGEPLGGRASAESDFADEEHDDLLG